MPKLGKHFLLNWFQRAIDNDGEKISFNFVTKINTFPFSELNSYLLGSGVTTYLGFFCIPFSER